ncbi:hypothetical protein EVAR_40928_1 [Eumeta japonica]|uniref:Uncharacterized protein n=1 Tax=Eumeta variegata TaxID=151549 RepID=A0A4C1X7M7_EUMVA|nr:hypothetical protein EVAR_40928_1 [Eumeta japonica]
MWYLTGRAGLFSVCSQRDHVTALPPSYYSRHGHITPYRLRVSPGAAFGVISSAASRRPVTCHVARSRPPSSAPAPRLAWERHSRHDSLLLHIRGCTTKCNCLVASGVPHDD